MNLRRVVGEIVQNTIDSTGLLSITTPFFALMESGILRRTDAFSRAVRIDIAKWSYFFGIARIYTWGRDKWTDYWNMTTKTHPFKKFLIETSYNGIANGIITPVVYLINGESDPKVIIAGILTYTCFSPVSGLLAGIGIDIFRSLANHYPADEGPKYMIAQRVGEMSNKARLGIAAVAIAATCAATEGIYKAMPDCWAKPQASIESVMQGSPSHLEEMITTT